MSAFYRNPNGANSDFSLRGNENPEVLIFAEGPSESYFLDKWLSSINKNPSSIAVVCYKGDKKKLATFLKNLILEENFANVKSFGFFLDAEANLAKSTVQSIQTLLKDVGLIPQRCTLVSGFQTVAQYRIGIYISPNNSDSGWIEDVVIHEIRDSNLQNCIRALEHSVQIECGIALHSKSIVQSYMSIRQAGLCGTGHGFSRGILDVNHAAYDEIKTVLGAIL